MMWAVNCDLTIFSSCVFALVSIILNPNLENKFFTAIYLSLSPLTKSKAMESSPNFGFKLRKVPGPNKGCEPIMVFARDTYFFMISIGNFFTEQTSIMIASFGNFFEQFLITFSKTLIGTATMMRSFSRAFFNDVNPERLF